VRAAGTTSNALHLNASVPSGFSANGKRADTWSGVAATGDQAVSGASTTAFAVCLQHGPHGIRVVSSQTAGPTQPNSWTRTTATCPASFVVVGGGAQTEPETTGGLKPIGSFPSDNAGNPAADSASNPTSWTAVGLNGGMPAPGAVTRAFALCARGRKVSTLVVAGTVAGPTAASTIVTTTATCPTAAAIVLLGGGAFLSVGGSLPQSGVHLRASYPSDAAGNPILSGTAPAWSETTQSGGMPAPGTSSTVFALCGRST
jgi:hypothetical protein